MEAEGYNVLQDRAFTPSRGRISSHGACGLLIPYDDVEANANRTAGTRENQLSLLRSGILPAIDYWISAVETIYRASQKQQETNMEAASKAQGELERIEKQIEQLESAAGDNQEARRQLHEMHVRVDALRRQMAGQLTPWERTELAVPTPHASLSAGLH